MNLYTHIHFDLGINDDDDDSRDIQHQTIITINDGDDGLMLYIPFNISDIETMEV